MFPLNRLVVLLTPVFSAGAAVGSAWAAKHFPGLPVPSQGEITAMAVAGATAAFGAAASWLHGHQKYEQRLDEAEKLAISVAGTVTDAVEKASQPSALTVPPVDPEALAKAHARIAELERFLSDARSALGGAPAVAATAPAVPAQAQAAAPAS